MYKKCYLLLLILVSYFFLGDITVQAQSCINANGNITQLITGGNPVVKYLPLGCDPKQPNPKHPAYCTSRSETCQDAPLKVEDCRDYSSCGVCVGYNFSGYKCGNKGRCKFNGSTSCTCNVYGCGEKGCSPGYRYQEGNNCAAGNGCFAWPQYCKPPAVTTAPTNVIQPTATLPPPNTVSCNCSYTQICELADGRKGTQRCNGVRDNANVCKWDESRSCNPSCDQCIPDPTPTVEPTATPGPNAPVCAPTANNACGCTANCRDGATTDYACCHRSCVNINGAPTCQTVPGPGTNDSNCAPGSDGLSCGTAQPPPAGSCNISNPDCSTTWTTTGQSCGSNVQCGGGADWCYAGCCGSCTGTPSNCDNTTKELDCSIFKAQRKVGNVIDPNQKHGIEKFSAEPADLYIEPNDNVLFTLGAWRTEGGSINEESRLKYTGTTTMGCNYKIAQPPSSTTPTVNGTGDNCFIAGDPVPANPGTMWTNANLAERRFPEGKWTVSYTSFNDCPRQPYHDNETDQSQLNVCEINIKACTDVSEVNPGLIRINGVLPTADTGGNLTTSITNVGAHTLSWDAVAGAKYYAVRIDKYPATGTRSWRIGKVNADGSCDAATHDPGDLCTSISGTQTSYSSYTFEAGYNYHITISAVNGCGEFSKESPTTVNYQPKGTLNAPGSCDTPITGWSCDLDFPTSPIEVHLYDGDKNAGGILIETVTANIDNNTIGTACGGTTPGHIRHGFSLDLPPEFKDGDEHKVYAYGINDDPNPQTVLLNNAPITIRGCADKWIKLKDYSYSNPKLLPVTNKIPTGSAVLKYKPDDLDDVAEASFIGNNFTNGPGIATGIGVGNYGGIHSGPRNWNDVMYITSKTFDKAQYLTYIKSRKNYRTIRNMAEITAPGIYVWDSSENITINTQPAHNYVLIVPNANVTIGPLAGNTFNTGTQAKSVAIIANTITFADTLTEARGIFIADTIHTGDNTSQGLKITGNIIATEDLRFNREWNPNENTRPSLYIVNEPKIYIDLLQYISTAIYESKEIE